MNSKKKHYQKPSFNVIKLELVNLIAQTGGGEGASGSREHRRDWDDE